MTQLAPVRSASASLAGQSPAAQQQRAHHGVVDHVELVQCRRHGRRLEPARHPRPVPVQFVVADQRRRILVADVDRLRVVALPKIGQANEIQARPKLVVLADQVGQCRFDACLQAARPCAGSTRQRLDCGRQAVQRGGVSAHDPLTLVCGEPPDRPVRRVVAPVRVVRGEHDVVAEIHHLEVLAVLAEVDLLERLGGEPHVFADVVGRPAAHVRQIGLALLPDSVHARHHRHRPGEATLDEHHPQVGMPVEGAVEHQAHQMRYVQQRPRREEVVPVRGVADRIDGDQLERRLPHQVCRDRKPVSRSGFVHRIEMRAAERDAPGLRRHQDLGHVRVAGPPLDLSRRGVGILCRDTDRSAPAAVPVVVAEPHIGEPVVVSGLQNVLRLRQLRIAHRFQHSDTHTGVDEQLFGGEVRIASGDTASRRTGVDTQRVRLVRVRRVIEMRDRRDRVTCRPELVLPLRGSVRLEDLARHRQWMHVGIDDRHRDLLGDGVVRNTLDGCHVRLPSTSVETP